MPILNSECGAFCRGMTRGPENPRAIALLLATAVALLTGCSRGPDKASPPRGKGMPVPVTVAVAAQKDVPIQLQAVGTVRPYATVSVKPRVDGQLGQIGFKQGEEVKEGDL